MIEGLGRKQAVQEKVEPVAVGPLEPGEERTVVEPQEEKEKELFEQGERPVAA